MMGTTGNTGLIPRICEGLFGMMKDPDTTYRVQVSYLEIYNERVRDLLRDKNQPQLNLKVREHPKDGPYVQDLSRHLVVSFSDVEDLIRRGNLHRTTAATNMNEHSSRSHAIFTVFFTQAKLCEDVPSEIHSKVHLVDLAGSERADSSGATGDRLKEGGSINKSLVTLGNVISTLADWSDRAPSLKRSAFIPYRDSVLTWLLKDSLGGNARTIMIATVSPADFYYAESLSTLRYASRAKKIVNKPTVNEDPHVKLIRELREENAHLRSLLGETAFEDVLPSIEDFVETREKLNRNEERVRELTEKWADKWQETANVLEHKSLALRKEGTGVVLDSELPYILSIDDNILTTGMRLYHIKEGDTHMGRDDAAENPDIVLSGKLIEAEHCIIRHVDGLVTLIPLDGALCSVNNVRIHEPTKLQQGSIIRLGRGHLFRYNHPAEAARLREEMKNVRSSKYSFMLICGYEYS
ncbi:hypothetical protein CAPTEDRAFT_180938 [Capitella teleta]|uniref:Kinesin-like protein n=1 Tax=Capitella teleta TaxID=283909 RepID=R7UUM9_CAPTE|nr:hypothetical protein CAPTEDRAFT_180938 [Capitella teleta]|eukprot:ELU07622.1 hypothetical protein CAPTEDRAFT_180938 [Capitella teleta]